MYNLSGTRITRVTGFQNKTKVVPEMPREVIVILSNRRAQIRPKGGSAYSDLIDYLKYRVPGWEYTYSGRTYITWQKMVKQGEADADEPQGWDGYRPLIDEHHRVGSGVILALKDELEKELDIRFSIKDQRVRPQFYKHNHIASPSGKRIRDYQRECFEAMWKASKTGGLILNATGTGKTFTTGLYLKALKGRSLFLVDELTLLKQAQEELRAVLQEDVGQIGNSIFDPKRVTVATIQTIHKYRFDETFVPWTRTLQAIIIDEVHLALNRRNFQTVAAIRPPVIFGLTATLELKKRHIAYRAYDLCGPEVFSYPLQQGVEEGYLSKGLAVQVIVDNYVQLPRILGNPRWRWVRNQYKKRHQQLYTDVIVEGKERNRTIASLVMEAYKRGLYTIVLLERIKHLKTLSDKLWKIPHELVYGAKHVDERVRSKKRFDAGKLRVILTNKVFKKGVDIKKVNLIIDGAAMKSKNDAVQKYGRGVRLSDGKEGLIYLDIADKNNKFEKAAKSRQTALKKLKIPVYKVRNDLGAKRILELAQEKLKELR